MANYYQIFGNYLTSSLPLTLSPLGQLQGPVILERFVLYQMRCLEIGLRFLNEKTFYKTFYLYSLGLILMLIIVYRLRLCKDVRFADVFSPSNGIKTQFFKLKNGSVE